MRALEAGNAVPDCGHSENRHAAVMSGEHWTYSEWAENTIEKIVTMGLALPEEHRADWLRLQIGLAIKHAVRHGRSGLGDDDPVVA